MSPVRSGPYAELQTLIAAVRRRWNACVLLRTAGSATAIASVPLLAAAGLAYVTKVERTPLVLLELSSVVAAAGAAATVALRMRRRPGDRQVARFIEERAGSIPGGRALDDVLVSAVDVAASSERADREPFNRLIVDRALHHIDGIGPAAIVTPRSIRAAAARAIAGAVALAIAIAASAPAAGRALETARLQFLPGSVRVEVTPGDARLPAGSTLRIQATVHGATGALTRFPPSLTIAAGRQLETTPMSAAGDGFERTIQPVERTFSYSVSAGAARSRSYTVTALFPPRVKRIDVHYVYPSFAGLPPRDEQDGGDIYAPAGTRIRLRIHADKPIARGEISLGTSVIPLRAAGAEAAEADLVLAKDDSYRVKLSDPDGLHSSGDPQYFIRLMDDRPPDVRILRPSADQQVTPLEEIAIEARADDDYGISGFDLVYGVAGRAERTVPFTRVTGTNVQKIGTHLLSAEALGVRPGDVIMYYARARDVGRGKRSTQATSDIFFLEVKPFSEEFVAALSQGGGAGGTQLDSLIESQKAIISSTWNVERRARAGRSSEDVKAIADAQAELKTRAERMGPRRRWPGRTPFPQRVDRDLQRPAPDSARDPIAAAVEAMSKALQQLSSDRTRDALPHEMAALNGLLQAQAEIRRRQVSQQANGGGSGGSNRSGQDLTALFDKELQRQQRTNYETQSPVEERPEADGVLLDRIRELARRQEDLSRRQRELARSELSEDEMKRQLEKLTREQTELREQAEELSRRMAGGESTQRQSRQSSTPGSGTAGDLRGVIDRMRAATNELRGNPGAAAQSGERAAEQLRQIEGKLDPKASPESRRLSSELDQTRAIRDRLQRAEENLRDAEGSAARAPARTGGGTAGRETPLGPGRADSAGSGGRANGEVARLKEQYRRELQRAEEALGRLSGGRPQRADGMSTPEDQEFSRSAPGTEAFKQDRSGWESLRKDIDLALDRYEAALSDRLARNQSKDRFSAGGSDRVPEAYRRSIARYFESLAKGRAR